MSFTVFLGNLPPWVTADDVQSWLNAEALVADSIKVIRNPETQESKGFAFIEAPNAEEMQSIIRRFDRAPLEDKLLRANPAQPPKGKGAPMGRPEERRPGMGFDRRREGAPMGARTASDRPAGDRPAGDRTAGDRAAADRPAADRAASDRPAADRSAAEARPSGEARPAGDARPSADARATSPAGERSASAATADRNRGAKRRGRPSGTSAFAEELAKAL